MASSLPLPAALIRVYERHGRSLPRVAEICLAILLAQALAILAWEFVPGPEDGGWRPPTVAASAIAPSASGPDVEGIASAHLFGEYQAPDPALSDLNDAPDTRLDLTLLGILASATEGGSRALISSSNGEEKPYAIGDEVVRGAKLQAIFPDRIILARAGQLETLRLNKDAPGKPLPSDSHAAAAGGTIGADTTQMLSNIREELLSDPSRAAEYIRIQPASNGGQLRGYRIYPGRDRAAFNAVGLRPGDLVTQVNGIQLNDANTALQMLGQLGQSNNITVMVERGGQQQTVNVNFN